MWKYEQRETREIRFVGLLCLPEETSLEDGISPVLGDIVIVASTIVTISSRQCLHDAFSRISRNNPRLTSASRENPKIRMRKLARLTIDPCLILSGAPINLTYIRFIILACRLWVPQGHDVIDGNSLSLNLPGNLLN